MAIVNNTQSIQAGVQNALMETWRQKYPVYAAQQKAFLHYLPFTDIRKAPYAFKDRIPMPTPWPYGSPRQHKVFQDRKIDVNILPYELTISWDSRDESDDLMKDLKVHVQQSVKRFLQVPDILISEYLGGTAVYNYDGLSNAYDGVGLYSTLDGAGATRYGVTGGNVLTGAGTTTTAAVSNDIINVRRRFLDMLEPVVGQPLHDPEDVTYKRMVFIVPPQLDGVFSQLQKLQRLATDPAINTAQDNLVMGELDYKVNQRLADSNDWYVVLQNEYWKPFAYRAPSTLRQFMATMENSDIARELSQHAVYNDQRIGLTPWCPWVTIQVSNS